MAVLRQELDSMVRAIYLLGQPTEVRAAMIDTCVGGGRWGRAGKSVTDREMVELSQQLQGWTASVYKFGCAFIHLSALHDYNDRDPLALLSASERQDLLEHCRYYHGGPLGDEATFSDLVPYLPSVLKKIADNLECYVGDLQNGRTLDDDV